MALSNNMSKLLNKIERRLGTKQLNLPDYLQKDNWVDTIIEESVETFSRYFPHKIRITVNQTTARQKGDYWILDENMFNGVKIIGVRDLAWDDLVPSGGVINSQASSYGVYDYFSSPYGIEDIGLIQARADQLSLFNNGIYVEFEDPNKLCLKSSVGINLNNSIKDFKIDLLIQHSSNLNTISPTKMETFEQLAVCDVASYLYNELKYYDGLETVFASIDLKLSDLQNYASNRENLVNKLEESYVSAANDNQPIMYST